MKKTAIRVAQALGLAALFCAFAVYLLAAGHVVFKPTPSYLTEGTGVTDSTWHAYGWEDVCYLVRMSVSAKQLEAVVRKYHLATILTSGRSEQNLREILANFLDERPYWWHIDWNEDVRFYEAERDRAGFYARAVYDPRSGVLLLRYFDA